MSRALSSALALWALAVLGILRPLAVAGTVYWDGGTSGSWNDATNWTSNRYAISSASIPGGGDDAVLDYSGTVTNALATLDANQAVNSLTVVGGTRTVAAGNTLTLGAGGLSLYAGTSTFNNAFLLGASQTWLNRSGAVATFGGNIDLNGSALTASSRNSITVTGDLTNSGAPASSSLTVVGAGYGGGTFTLSSPDTAAYTGDTTLNSGLMNLNFANMAAPTNLINSNSKLVLGAGQLTFTAQNNVGSAQTFNNTDLKGASFLVATPTGTGSMTATLGTITRSLGGALNFSSSGAFNVSNGNDTAGILGGWATYGGASGATSNSVTFAKNNGSGVVVSAGNGTMTNTEALLAGATAATNANVTGNITLSTTAKNYSVGTFRFDNNYAISGAPSSGTSTITIGSGGIIVSNGASGSTNRNALSLGNDAASTLSNVTVTSGSGSLVVHMFGASYFGLKYALTGTMDLIRTGPGGQLALKNNTTANNFTGTIYVYQGELYTEQGDQVFGNAANSFVIDNGGTISFNGTGAAAVGASRTFTIGAGGGTVSIGNNVSNSFGTRFTLNGPLTISNQGGSGVQSFGAIGGGGDLIISNTGTGTGAIAASASSAFGATIPVAFASNSNTKRLRLNGYSVTVGGLSTGATVGTSIVESNSGTAGTDTLTVVRNTTDQTFAGVLQDGSTRKLALKKDGTNTLTLSGTNTFTGGVTISNGVLAIGSTGALNSTTPNAVTFAASAPSGTKLALNGNSVAVSSLSSTSTNPVVENANAAAATLTLGLAGSSTYGGIFQDGSGGGALSFVKNGAGTFTLSSAGSSTYTGTTTVNAGTLLIDFANMATPTNVGSAASAVTLNGATLSVKGKSGGNVSAQTIAALTINNAASAIVIDPNEGTSATLTITSTAVNRTAPAMLNFNTSAGTPATAMIAWNPTPTGGIIGAPYTITDNGGTGFAAVSAGYVVRYTGATPLTATNPTSASTDFSASGAVTNTVAPTAQLNSLAIDTSGGAGSWDLGTSTAEVTTGGLLMTGGSNYTISNGSLKSITPSNSDLAVNQFGTGVLEIAATIVDGNGASTLTKTGPGKLVLSANNGYTGVSYVNAGTLQIGNAGAAGSVIGNIVNNAAVIINRTTDLTYAGVVSGTGSLTQAGSATLILTNVNTYSGGTTISAGTLQLGDGTTNGSIVGNVTDNATFAFANPTAQTFSGAISGTGSLTKGAAGVLTLSGTNSYQGSTTITAGTISIAADANLGTAPGGATPASIVLNGGALSATASFPLSTYRGVALGPAGGSGTGTIDVASGMTLTYGGIIANNTGGTGALSKTGAGVLYVTAQATHSGGTTLGADSGRLEYNVGSNVAFGTGGVTLGGGSYRRREYCGTTTNRTDATPFSIGASGGTIAASNDNFTSGNLNLTLSGAFTGSGTVTLDAGGGLPQSGSQTTNGSIFLSGDNSGFSGTMSLSRTTGSGCFRFNNANALNVINDGSIQWTGTGYPVGVVFNAMEAQLNKLAPGPNCTVGIDGITSNIDLTSPTLGWANKGTVRLGASQNTTYAGQVTANLVYKFSAVSGVTLTLSHADALTGSTAATLYAVNGNGGIVAVSETNASYSGAITVNANAVLQIGAGGAAGGIGTGSVVNNGTLQFNRSGSFLTFSNNISGSGTVTQSGTPTLLTLTGTNTHSVSTTVSGGALATNTTGLSSANLNLSGGVFLLDGTGADSLTWAQFAANRSLGYGGGASQWQITGAGGGFAARNADVTIDSSASTNTSFDNSFTLGMYQKSGGNLIANKAVNINRQITLSAATDRTWNVLGGVQGQAVGAATYWNVSGPVNEISGKITGGASGRILSFENSNGTQGTGGIVRLSNTANDFTANIRIGTATQYAPVLIVPDIAVLGNAANTVTLGKIATDYAGGLLLFEDQAGTGKSFTKNLAIGHQRSGGTLSGFGAYAGQVTYTGTVSGNFSGAGGQPFADAVHVQSGATMTLGDVSPAIFKQVTPAVGSGGLGLYKSGAGTLILNNVQYLASDSTDNSGRSPWMVVGGALRETGSTATTSAVNNSYSGGTMAGVYLSGGVLEFGATPRPLSLGNGVGQIRFDGNGQVINNDNTIYLSNANGGGFSAYGADRTVSLNAGAALTWAGTTGTSAYFVRNGAPLIFGSQTANATLIFQNDINLNTAVREIRVNKSLTSGDSARLTGVLSGTGASGVNKTGAGTLVLSGTNSYTGATNVNQGTLLVNGNQSAATGAVTVASTATLGGTGTIGGAVTVQNGGTVQPGTSPGTLTLASGVSIAAGATMNWQHNAGNALGTPGADPGYSTINLTGGSATIDNTPTTGSLLKLSFASGTSFADSFWDSGHSWNIITGGLSAGNFFDASNITVYVNNVQQDTGNTIPGQGSFTSQVSGNNLELDWTASTVGPVNSTWTGLSSPPDANWSTPGNWSAGVPDGPGATASFTGATPAAVALDGVVNRTLGHLNLSGTTGYTIGTLGGNKLRMDNTGGSPSGNATISAAFGAHTIAAQVVTTSASDLDISAPTGGGLSLTGGIDNAAAKALGLAQSGEGALEVGSILNAGTMTVSGTVGVKAVSSGTGANTTIVSASANLTATSIVQDTLTINAGGSVTIRETTVLAGSGAGASPVPEPGTWVLVGIGLLSLLAFRRRR